MKIEHPRLSSPYWSNELLHWIKFYRWFRRRSCEGFNSNLPCALYIAFHLNQLVFSTQPSVGAMGPFTALFFLQVHKLSSMFSSLESFCGHCPYFHSDPLFPSENLYPSWNFLMVGFGDQIPSVETIHPDLSGSHFRWWLSAPVCWWWHPGAKLKPFYNA